MNILLTHGYFLAEDEKEQQIMRPYPPLGLLYVSSFLEENGYKNEVFDSTFESKSALYAQLDRCAPEVVAVYTNLMTKLNVLDIMDYLKTNLPETIIVLGGPDVTYNVTDYLKNGAHFIVIGEGEVTMLELARSIEAKDGSHRQLEGIAYLDECGEVVRNPPRKNIQNIDDLPLPNRDGIDLTQYLKTWKDFHGQSALNVSTQRGCPYTCKWCSTAVYGQSYRRRSPREVVLELEELQRKYKPDTIWFVDDVFTVSHKWLSAFVEELRMKGVNIKFECISRADRMNAEVIRLLKAAGCFRIWIGAESGSQRIIDAMDRRVSVEQVREMIIATRRAGIEAGTFIMLGYPGETIADIRETLHHLKTSNPDHFTITVAYPIKGTTLYEEVADRQTRELDWRTGTDRDRDFERTYQKRFYKYAAVKVVSEVNYFKRRHARGLDRIAFKLKVKSILADIAMRILSLKKVRS